MTGGGRALGQRRRSAGRLARALVPVVVLAMTVWHSHAQHGRQMTGLERRIEERLHELPGHLNDAELHDTEYAVERAANVAFVAVRAAIRPYADRRYSWWSRWSDWWVPTVKDWLDFLGLEDASAPSSRFVDMREDVKSRLLEGLEDRIAAGATRGDSVMRRELLAEIDDWFDREAVSVSPWLQGDYRRMLEPVRAHARSMMGPSGHDMRLAWESAAPAAVDAMTTEMALAVLEAADRDALEARLTEIVNFGREEVGSSLMAAIPTAKSEVADSIEFHLGERSH